MVNNRKLESEVAGLHLEMLLRGSECKFSGIPVDPKNPRGVFRKILEFPKIRSSCLEDNCSYTSRTQVARHTDLVHPIIPRMGS